MTLEERAASIADKSLGTARGALRRQRIYDEALKMLHELAEEEWRGIEDYINRPRQRIET